MSGELACACAIAAAALVAAPARAGADIDAAAAAPPPELQADLGLSVIGLAYEQPVGAHVAVQLEADITSTYFAPWFDAGDRVDGYALGLRASWFPRGGARGLYVAPYVRVARVTTSGVAGSGVGTSGGAFVGWAWALPHRIDVRLGVGAQYYDYEVHGTGTSTPFVALDAVVGYRL